MAGTTNRLVERVRRKRAWMRRQRKGLVQYESRYLNWMSFANAGMFHAGHRHLIDTAVKGLPKSDPVLEIGSLCGLTTNVLTYFLETHDRPNILFSTDPWELEGEGGETLPDSSIPFSDYRKLVREQFERNVRFWSGNRLPHAFPLASDDFFAAWRAGKTATDVFGRETSLGGPLAFCFVDGAHERGQVERDLRHADEFLVPGGFVLFDDSDEFGAFPHIHDVVQATIRGGRYELVAANPHHLLRKR